MYGVQSIPGMGLSAHIRKLCVYKQKDFYSGGVPYVEEKKAEACVEKLQAASTKMRLVFGQEGRRRSEQELFS